MPSTAWTTTIRTRARAAAGKTVAGLAGATLALVALGLAATPVLLAQDETPPPRASLLEDPGVPSVSTAGWATDFSRSAVPFDQIRSGGPGKDGIPAIDEPHFESIEGARAWLTGRSPVIALEIDGDARGYPLAILTWHEIVNDMVGGVPVIVTFCPLCNTALVYERTLDEQVLDFGVSGNLRYSDMVMYDRQTESWWQQATGQGIVGELAGAKLEFIPAQLVGLDQFARAFPEGLVLSRDTGEDRPYGRNHYLGYDDIDEPPFLFDGVVDGRLAPKERVVALGGPGSEEPISIPFSVLRRVGAINLTFEGRPIAVLWQPGSVSALDGSVIDESEDVGASGVFSAVVGAMGLTFVREGGEEEPITDLETGSTWDVTGRATEGPLAGTSLQPVGHGNHFWFAWAAFVPETRIWTGEGIAPLDEAE